MQASDHYSAGQLAEAVQAALNHVKSAPTDIGGRLFLAELLCFQGEWERAERQLEAVTKQSPDVAVYAGLLRQLIRGEVLREQVFSDGAPPQLIGELPADAKLQLELMAAARNGDTAMAASLVEQADQARQPVAVRCNEAAYEDVRDLDDRLAGVVEVITTNGKYYWVPWKNIRSLEMFAPERPADLIWRRVAIDVVDGPEGEVYVPTRYPLNNQSQWDDQLRLGRATTWLGEETGVVSGAGQRMLMIGGDSIAWLEVKKIEAASDV